jgi:hypothetical protein
MAHIWEKSYSQGVSWDVALPPPVALESLLENAAAKWPDRIALDFYDRTFTFRELEELTARAAKGLQALGVGPGVHVGLHLPNTPHFVIAFFAVLMAGGRVVNFSPLLAPRELKYQIEGRRDESHDHARPADALPANRGAQGHRQIRNFGWCAASPTSSPPRSQRRRFGPAAERVGGVTDYDIKISSPSSRDVISRHT